MAIPPSAIDPFPQRADPLRISLDARFIGFAGIGRMTIGLWRGLLALGADVVGLWPAGPPSGWMGVHRPAPAGQHVIVRARPFLPAEQLIVPNLLRRMAATVHHAPNFSIPYLTHRPVVLTVHDLFPYLDPANARSPAAAAMYRAVVPLAIRRARLVVAVSPFAAQQVREAFGLDENRLRIVGHGIDQERWRRPADCDIAAARARYGLPEDYLLYVGTLKRHKNVGTLLAAHRPTHPPLVLAGAGPAELLEARFPQRGGQVIALGRVPDYELAALYGGARALMLPSLYEAVGFTALEAMACGTPVVSSDGGGLPDTVGGGGLLVPAQDVGAWTEAITTVSEQESVRRRLVTAGQANVKGRSWREAATRYLEIYKEAAA